MGREGEGSGYREGEAREVGGYSEEGGGRVVGREGEGREGPGG